MPTQMQRTVIDDFQTITTQLILEAAAYAASSTPDEETEANIRKLRTLSSALNSALQSVQFVPRMPTMQQSVPTQAQAAKK